VSLELSTLQSFDSDNGSFGIKLHQSKATGAPGTVAGDADGADLSVGGENLAQVTVGDLRG
jgi:hypothetical protein